MYVCVTVKIHSHMYISQIRFTLEITFSVINSLVYKGHPSFITYSPIKTYLLQTKLLILIVPQEAWLLFLHGEVTWKWPLYPSKKS